MIVKPRLNLFLEPTSTKK